LEIYLAGSAGVSGLLKNPLGALISKGLLKKSIDNHFS